MFKLLNHGGRKRYIQAHLTNINVESRVEQGFVRSGVKYLESLRIRMSLAIIKGASSSFSKTIEVFFDTYGVNCVKI